MAIKITVKDPFTGQEARVTDFGELVTGNLSFSEPISTLLGEDNTPVEIAPPKTNQIMVVTDLILYANRNVGVNDARVILYESEESAVAQLGTDKVFFDQEMLKQSTLPLTGLNWKVGEGKFLNATTSDDDVFVNLACYYAPSDANLAVPQ